MSVRIVPIEDTSGYPNVCCRCYERDAEAVILWPRHHVPICHPCLQDLADALAEDA